MLQVGVVAPVIERVRVVDDCAPGGLVVKDTERFQRLVLAGAAARDNVAHD